MTLCKAVGISMEHPSVLLLTFFVIVSSVVETPLVSNGVQKKDCFLFEVFQVKMV